MYYYLIKTIILTVTAVIYASFVQEMTTFRVTHNIIIVILFIYVMRTRYAQSVANYIADNCIQLLPTVG